MKKSIRGFVLGVVMTVILTSTVVGAQVMKRIEVSLNTIKVEVEGSKVVGDNILYNSTTYVPLRAIAEMLDYNVYWNGATNTASITKEHINEDDDIPNLSSRGALYELKFYLFGDEDMEHTPADSTKRETLTNGMNYLSIDSYNKNTGIYTIEYYHYARNENGGWSLENDNWFYVNEDNSPITSKHNY